MDAFNAGESPNREEFECYLPMLLKAIEHWMMTESARISVPIDDTDLKHAARIVKVAVIAFMERPASARLSLATEINQSQLLFAQRCAFEIMVVLSSFSETTFKDPLLAEYANARREARKPLSIEFGRDLRTYLRVSQFVRDLLNGIMDRRVLSNPAV
jgi:hypothetical protein